MAIRTSKAIVKVNVQCPHCGFEQLESMVAQSTICKNCSTHFEIAPKAQPVQKAASSATPSFIEKIVTPAGRKPHAAEVQRTVACFECGSTHKVSSLAKTTLCPSCGAYIDLQDFEINGLFSRSIRTRGRLVVQNRGDLNCGKAICGSAVIEGRIRGSLVCEGKAVLKCKGKLAGDIEANHLVVERGAKVEFLRPIRAGRVEIMGQVSGTIFCGTEVFIFKKGLFEGTMHAKSCVIEHGGVFVGDADIRPLNHLAEITSTGGAAARRRREQGGLVTQEFGYSH